MRAGTAAAPQADRTALIALRQAQLLLLLDAGAAAPWALRDMLLLKLTLQELLWGGAGIGCLPQGHTAPLHCI
jgi:hypothetical protein